MHEVGVFHRDLTPSNVLCSGRGADEIFKIADFGVAPIAATALDRATTPRLVVPADFEGLPNAARPALEALVDWAAKDTTP